MDAISIEEANKIRVAMGMKPLPMPGAAPGPVFKEAKASEDPDDDPASTIETRSAAAYDNYQKLQDEAAAKKKRDAQKASIKKARDQAQRFALLEGKGLGDEDEEMDTKSWLLSSKKRQKKIEKARKLEEEMVERERQAQAATEYTAADLAGVKVGHEMNEFGDGEEQILVLADGAVTDDEADDQLEAVDLKEKERLKEKLDSKKRKRVYDPNDQDEGETSVLAQYDEEILGKKKKAFTLDGNGRTVEEITMASQESSKAKKGMSISLDLLKDETPISDYMELSEIKVKKPKKKKKTSRKRAIDEDDIFAVSETAASQDVENGAMDIDTPNPAPVIAKRKKSTFDDSFVDDSDLQAQLAMQRRAALKKRKNLRPEDLVRQMQEEAVATPDAMDTVEEDEQEPGLVIDETSEFIANFRKPADDEERRPVNGRLSMSPESPVADAESDVEMAQTLEDEPQRTRSVSVDMPATGLDDETTLDRGIGAALTLLRQRGIVQGEDAGEMNTALRERQRFLAEKQKAEEAAERKAREQRDQDRKSGRLDRMDARDREAYARSTNQAREHAEARKQAEMYKGYTPTFELKYTDEYGRNMDAKEAFRHLSHQFHGKGSGKMKTEKHLSKIEAEKKRLAASNLDSSQNTGMSSAQGAQAKKHKQAGVRLQ